MTSTSSAISATTPMSWVMNITRHAVLGLQALDQVENFGLGRDVERGRRLVGDQQGGIAGERHRDHRALAHAAGKLERIAVDRAVPERGSRPAAAARSCARGPAFLLMRQCSRSTSTIWSPTVCTGDSEDIGSWKIIAISSPRTARIARPFGCSLARSTDARRRRRGEACIEPDTMRPGASTICRIERAITLLPEPLSPTTQSVRPRMHVERHAVDRLHDAVAHGKIRRQIAHLAG